MGEISAMPAKPLALSDAQLDIVFRLAAPLLDVDRGLFLQDVARELGGLPEIGDGVRRPDVRASAAEILAPARARWRRRQREVPLSSVWLPPAVTPPSVTLPTH